MYQHRLSRLPGWECFHLVNRVFRKPRSEQRPNGRTVKRDLQQVEIVLPDGVGGTGSGRRQRRKTQHRFGGDQGPQRTGLDVQPLQTRARGRRGRA